MPGRNSSEPDQAADDHAQSEPQPRSDDGLKILASLLAGILCYGGIGWLIDKSLNTNWVMALGMVVGLGLSVYAIIKKYGSDS